MLLCEYLDANGMKQCFLADLLGLDEATMSELVRTSRYPSHPRPRYPDRILAARIMEATKGKVTIKDLLYPHGAPTAETSHE